MKKKLILFVGGLIASSILTIVVESNIIVTQVSKGKCYDDMGAVPHNEFGMLLGTGRSSAPSTCRCPRAQ